MNSLTIKEISSFLSTRKHFPKKSPTESPPHKNWDSSARAAIVILWGLLVYPQLDKDLQQRRQKKIVTIAELQRLFFEYLGSKEQCMQILLLLKNHDYIRMDEEQTSISAGTELYKAVDALKMYRLFRDSIISRSFYQQNQ
ncbi:hypothetical protein SAMN04487866_10871 [Thermoactinomyces sp. DSM 45891]|uniref:hypothetical protein n=1 Tax=Thermoactinomyces sp. DSM 45891 TaxID=1761907 RepID=UPI000910BB64|nr:hypothetical protein [Thermoactinomyces sp. DSM 45891]SFX45549.1 hypothetical protein SAMN04487866_10871 [Thermoactinomyces sp. DSM 45891]